MSVGIVEKMKTEYDGEKPVQYFLPLGENSVSMNQFLGNHLKLTFTGDINCLYCNRKIKKSFSQGFCYPCFTTLPQADMCIVKPETCHFHKNTCRDSSWGQKHCFIDHTIYLSNSSDIKVGITRGHQKLTRWIDQGAVSAMTVCNVKNRLDAGRVEVALKKFVADKTNWRKMLKNEVVDVNLQDEVEKIRHQLPSDVELTIPESDLTQIIFPVLEYPQTIKSHNFDKNAVVEGTLLGIKGQYLIFDTGVINIRKYGGYNISVG